MVFNVTNANIVPYNAFLSLKYNCHINVEKSNSARNVKYLYKYVTKGGDRAMVSTEVEGQTGPRDEISNYKDLRSCGSNEAVWHLLEFPVAQRFPSVMPLKVHLKDEHCVTFNEGEEENRIEKCTGTELTAFFELNRNLNAENKKLIVKKKELFTYVNVPRHCTWDKKKKMWKERVQKCRETLGRIHSIHPGIGVGGYYKLTL